MTHRNLSISIYLAVLALVMPAMSNAQAASASTPQRALTAPFGLTLGKASLPEAEAKWAEEGAVVTNRGYAAIGAGSGINGLAKSSAEKILLVDIDAVDFEGKRPARFVFFDGVLFSVQTVLKPLLNKGTNVQNLSEQEVSDLETQIRQRYGAPNHELRDMTAGKKPNVLIWDFGQNTLTLTIGTLAGSTLSYTNTALAKKANDYKEKATRSLRVQGAK